MCLPYTNNCGTRGIDVGSIDWVEPIPEGFEWLEADLSWARYL